MKRLHASKLQGLPPIARDDARWLLLGSFPGVQSLAQRRYFAHPKNQFWRILASVWSEHPLPDTYDARLAWLQDRKVALWDVYARCFRDGSLDRAIEAPEVNDLAGLCQRLPHLKGVLCNGVLAYRAARRIFQDEALRIILLPSSSPAHAARSFEEKCALWTAALRSELKSRSCAPTSHPV